MAGKTQQAGSQATVDTARGELRIVHTGGDEVRFTQVECARGEGVFLCVVHFEEGRAAESGTPTKCKVTTFIPATWIREAELVTPLSKSLKDLK